MTVELKIKEIREQMGISLRDLSEETGIERHRLSEIEDNVDKILFIEMLVISENLGKKITDLFIPIKGTKEYLKIHKLLKDSASKLKMEWLYVNRITIAIVTFFISLFLFVQLHQAEINLIYTEPTTEYNIMGGLTGRELEEAKKLTESDNQFLDMYKGNL